MALGHGYRALHCDRVGDVLCVAIQHPTNDLNSIDALLHGELAPRYPKNESARRSQVAATLHALLASVPHDLLPWYRDVFTEP